MSAITPQGWHLETVAPLPGENLGSCPLTCPEGCRQHPHFSVCTVSRCGAVPGAAGSGRLPPRPPSFLLRPASPEHSRALCCQCVCLVTPPAGPGCSDGDLSLSAGPVSCPHPEVGARRGDGEERGVASRTGGRLLALSHAPLKAVTPSPHGHRRAACPASPPCAGFAFR